MKYRYDPVPGIHRKNGWYFSCHYKSFNNLQEKKRYLEDSQYCKVNKKRLEINAYNDILKSRALNSDKTWKLHKIKKQWMKKLGR